MYPNVTTNRLEKQADIFTVDSWIKKPRSYYVIYFWLLCLHSTFSCNMIFWTMTLVHDANLKQLRVTCQDFPMTFSYPSTQYLEQTSKTENTNVFHQVWKWKRPHLSLTKSNILFTMYKKKLAFSSVSMSKLEFCAEFLEKIVHVKWPYTLQRQIDDEVSYLGQVTRQLKVMQSTWDYGECVDNV